MNNDDDDTPIRGLAGFQVPVSENLVGMVRRKIQRRKAAAEFTGFSWSAPGMVLIEFINIIAHLLSVIDGKKDNDQSR
jgi:hypothetical protein